MGVEDLGTDAQSVKTPVKPVKRDSAFRRLYVGSGVFDVVGKRKRWYIFFGALVLVCIASMSIQGFKWGIDFNGGTQIQMPANGSKGEITEQRAKDVFEQALGREADEAQRVGTGGSATIQLRSDTLNSADVFKLKQALFEQLGPIGSDNQPSVRAISDSAVSASWGGEISEKALLALGVFLLAVTIFLGIYFDIRMAAAALISLLHDIVVTAGIYSLVGFEVTPATVVGLLTILGFSLYDTVVVFDKVKENTRGLLGLSRRTFAEAANLALNQTLMRSINTAIIALLPILGLLVVGYLLLGSGTLQDLALIQLTGTLVGVLSSIALATPLLVDLKMMDPQYKQQAQRVLNRRAGQARKAAGKAQASADDDAFDPTDDDALDAELRREKAYAAAASVPARLQKARPQGKPSGKRKR
jgi:preprotein translocase subunit SecF